ncbi:MAG: hypothetical protein DIU83_04490, partial [Bacillota bacterium]
MAGTLACIGVGAMGEALVGGMVQAALVAPEDVFVADADDVVARSGPTRQCGGAAGAPGSGPPGGPGARGAR